MEGSSDATVEEHVAAMERELDMTKLPSAQSVWLYRMLDTARPLQEKMVLFWHGIDFRSVYGSALKKWLGADQKAALGARHEDVGFV